MKKVIVASMCAALVFSSCGTYTGAGAYTGSSIGSVLGSAIGGISGGPRGSDVGTIIGMAGGAIVGAAIGNAADNKAEREVHEHYERVHQQRSFEQGYSDVYGSDDSGFDANNRGDDRLYDFGGSDYTGNYTASSPRKSSLGNNRSSAFVVISNARFVDDNEDFSLNANEVCKVIFEVVNHSRQTLYDIQPSVVETTGNRHIYVSQPIHVERLAPGKAIRYTAMVKADSRLKNGTANFLLSVLQGGAPVAESQEFSIETRK